jgi:NADH:ubiquinone oxidoreductase subunit 3 (subunit A)
MNISLRYVESYLSTMNIRFIIFLIIVVILVAWAVVYELNRKQPWDSDVFFSELNFRTISLDLDQNKAKS